MSKIITPEDLRLEQAKCLPAHVWVNSLSWHNIGNKDEAQRVEFVKLTHAYRMKCIRDGMYRAATMLTDVRLRTAIYDEADRVGTKMPAAADSAEIPPTA